MASQPEQGTTAEGPELVFGLVGAVGAGLEPVMKGLADALASVAYTSSEVHLSDLLRKVSDRWEEIPESHEDVRVSALMDAGDDLRDILNRGEALAILGIGTIRRQRRERTKSIRKAAERHAYIIRSLKHPSEVEALREIYGAAFILVSAYAPRDFRIATLAEKIAASHNSVRPDKFLATAQKLIDRDEDEESDYGQNVRKTFPLADFFVNAADADGCRASLSRLVELIFANPYRTPTPAEYAMYFAQAAAWRSAALSRQVGAVLTSTEGEVLSAGANEVPKAGGGFYWEGDPADARDFRLGKESNDIIKRNNIIEALDVLRKNKWSSKKLDEFSPKALAAKAIRELKKTQLMNAIEYNRVVHAEMAAITGAAARGVKVAGCDLYTTTFPCHDCAKHVVGTGIRRVVYIEPYPKSLAFELHKDSIHAGLPSAGRVGFEPFVGIAPRMYGTVFDMVPRKDAAGFIFDWDKTRLSAVPRVPARAGYVFRETRELNDINAAIKANKKL